MGKGGCDNAHPDLRVLGVLLPLQAELKPGSPAQSTFGFLCAMARRDQQPQDEC